MKAINCRGTLLDLSSPKVMGILNLTPDSFFDGGKYTKQNELLRQAEKMLEEGCSILDLGGQSTKPGAVQIGADKELQRVIPALAAISTNFPEAIISVDTYWTKVAKEVVDGGASIINDISGGTMDEEMFKTIAKLKVPYVLMHMKGRPEFMQVMPEYINITTELLEFFANRIHELRALQVADIIVDVGFGFGKTLSHNYQLVKDFESFGIFECPILAGISRKSMIGKALGTSPAESLNSTTALNMALLERGANILRVHDVKEAMDCVKIWKMMH